MEIKGTIIAALPEVSGVSSRSGNPWKKREYVLENTEGNFPRKVAFTCFGENADKIQLQVGQAVTMYFDVESREYNGRWYTDVRAWRIQPKESAQPAPVVPEAAPLEEPRYTASAPAAEVDDLPF